MLYAIRWVNPRTHETVVTAGESIPDALHRAQMWSGIDFINADDKAYGILGAA